MPSDHALAPLLSRPEGRALRAEIRLDRIQRNLKRVQDAVGGRGVWAVIKANAYGHGSVPVGRALEAGGAAGLAVSSLEEGLELRDGGVTVPVMILGGLRPDAIPMASARGFTVAVVGPEHLEAYAELLPAHPLRLHLKLDTGMGRFGLLPSELSACLPALQRLAPWTEGVMGHFATSDDPDTRFAQRQRQTFEGCLQQLGDAGLHPAQRHHANSDACLRGLLDGDTHVRPGLALYGLTTIPEGRALGLEPALELVAEVARVKAVPAGTTVGYGRTFVAPQPMRIATLACGYADGYRRDLGNRAVVGFKGRCFPVVGRVSMDYLTVALPLDVEAAPGEPMTLFSGDPDQPHSLERLAQLLGTIPYELSCALHRRISRRYIP
ncbi:MAG TPA: alanine racemase [Holophagaceae bacterium]|nr:alanine racemase [Holophagaceae bacterium]